MLDDFNENLRVAHLPRKFFFIVNVEVALATGSYVFYAGVKQILYYEKSSNKVHTINGGWNIPFSSKIVSSCFLSRLVLVNSCRPQNLCITKCVRQSRNV